ncbi:MAG TPA: hypothetical protein DD624_08410 [Alphaproteobacteria bacterium]|nr:hypothetical protein [Alphaproteobacteria bacterium]
MKKLLLSAALLPLLTEQTFAAPAIELELGGFMTFYGTYANQRKSTKVPMNLTFPPLAAQTKSIGDYNVYDLMGDAEIYFTGSHTFENGIKAGAVVQLEAGTDSNTSNQVIDETYMTFDSKIGRIIAGNVKNASNMLAVRSPTASVMGFQETDFTRLIAVPALFAYNKATYATLDDISTKLSYLSPVMNGFSFGVSLMPGNKVKGKDADNLLIPKDGLKIFKRGVDATALYTHGFGKIRMDVSGSFSSYKPNLKANDIASKESNLNEYGGGIVFAVENWSFGGSYHFVNSNKFAAQAAAAVQTMGAHGASWEAGVKYEKDAFAVSANFMQSRADSFTADGKDDYKQYQLSARYTFAAGIDGFIDTAYLRYQSANTDRASSNRGFAAAAGVKLTF